MDKDRQIRMLIPPFFLFASVLWESYLSGDLWQYLHGSTNSTGAGSIKSILSLLAVLGVATLPIGYAIGVLTLSALRMLSWLSLFPHGTYDIPISEGAMEKIWSKLGFEKESPRKSVLCAAAAFDHVLLKPGIHEWLFRRWTTFNICTQCAMALVLSYGLGHALHVQATCKWWLTIGVSIVLFIWQAVTSWCETYEMFDLTVDAEILLREGS